MTAMNRSNRKSTLNQLVNKKLLSPEGLRALTKVTDPFHDLEVECVGIPDSLPEKSIVREVKKTITIGSPLADKTLPWDLHIFTLPERNFYETDSFVESEVASMNCFGEFAIAEEPNNFRIGPLVMVAVPAGQPTTPAGGSWPPVGTTSIQVLDFNDYFYGQSREIFSAFEVHNVTNKLNVGGTVTTYRLPQFTYDATMDVVEVSTESGVTALMSGAWGQVSRLPPGKVDDVMLLAGSRQWEAEHGCYCVETFNLEENQPRAAQFGVRAFVAGDVPGGVVNVDTFALPSVVRYIAYDNGLRAGRNLQPAFKSVPKDTSGAYFTGLPGATQLTITVRKGIETFPSFTDPLVTLARSTPDHDPVFFELYKHIAQELPSGVAVGENASGDFWDKILDIVGTMAPVIGPAFGAPGMAVGGAVSAAATAAKALREAREQQKARQKANDSDFKGGKAMVKAPSNVRTNIPKR